MIASAPREGALRSMASDEAGTYSKERRRRSSMGNRNPRGRGGGWTTLRAMERLPDGARLEKGPGGLERLVLSASDGEAVVYLQGGHVAHFQPRGERPVLWMSAQSRFEAGQPLRGGVPICFPWFGPKAGAPDAPMHGFARILPWSVTAVVAESGGLRATLDLTAEAAARGGFPHELALSLTVRVGRSLRLELAVRNTDAAARAFEAALHSYLAVSDVRHVRIRGLEGVAYVDKTAGGARAARRGRADRDRRRDRPGLPRRDGDGDGRGPRLAAADRRRQVGLVHDGRLEPVGGEGEGHARLRRRGVAGDGLRRDRERPGATRSLSRPARPTS